jgi:D-sedoheptulose 7-phosphate isomerase
MLMSAPRFAEFFRAYKQSFSAMLEAWDEAALARIVAVLESVRDRGGTLLIAGNGGSAAIANHTECDATKGTFHDGQLPLISRSLSANPSVLTAIGNDIGFASIFERQVDYYGRRGDALLLVSSSGNSPNVIKACEVAKTRGLVTIALVGFSGGALKDMADHSLFVASHNYGIVEDMHQASVHVVTQYLREIWAHKAGTNSDT